MGGLPFCQNFHRLVWVISFGAGQGGGGKCYLMNFLAKVVINAAHMNVPNIA